MRTGGVHCRESGTGPVVLKVVPGTGAAFSGFTMSRCFVRLSFSTPTNGIEVGSLWNKAFFAAFLNVAYTRFKTDKHFMDALLVHLRKRTGAGACGEATDGEPAPG